MTWPGTIQGNFLTKADSTSLRETHEFRAQTRQGIRAQRGHQICRQSSRVGDSTTYSSATGNWGDKSWKREQPEQTASADRQRSVLACDATLAREQEMHNGQ